MHADGFDIKLKERILIPGHPVENYFFLKKKRKDENILPIDCV
jgi:hypothetical protein